MFISEVKKPLLGALLMASVMTIGSVASEVKAQKIQKNVDGAVMYPIKDGHYQAYAVNKQKPVAFKYGRTPTAKEIAAWDIDVMPDGTGLPEGKGSVEEGDALYADKCAMCHGDFGMGGKGYPVLSGGQGTLKNQLIHPEKGDEPPIRTIGSYWPYASTLFWYIQSAMPFPNPKSLSNDETYALVAYLLSVNDIQIDGKDLDDDYVLDRAKFLKIKMPNADGFYPNVDGGVGTKEARKFLSNPENYAKGTRCMKNCSDAPVVHIAYELKDFHPVASTVRDLPKKKEQGKISNGHKLYEATCSVCHANKAIGAPLVGDKQEWGKRIKKGINGLYKNAINGINAMPPKGGNASLSDKEIKEIVDYMVKASK